MKIAIVITVLVLLSVASLILFVGAVASVRCGLRLRRERLARASKR